MNRVTSRVGSLVPSPSTLRYTRLVLLGCLAALGCNIADRIEERRPLPSSTTSAAAAPSPTVAAPTNTAVAITWLPATVGRHAPLFAKAATTHHVDAELLAIVTLVESGGYIRAVSGSGARGLMQIMPSTGVAIAEQRGLADHQTALLFRPKRNIDYGAYYLAEQFGRFGRADGDASVGRVAAAYNGGPTTLMRHLAGRLELSAQTVRYRYWVKGMWMQRRLPQSERLDAWRAAGGERLLEAARHEMAKGRGPGN